jgi:hypothetical protein
MINAAALNNSLKLVLDGGVDTVLLFTTKGSLLASASLPTAVVNQNVIVAAVTNMWRACATNDLAKNPATGMLEPESLEALLVDIGDHKICAVGVAGSGIICIVGQQAELGMLKLKAASLQRHLDASLRGVLE